MALATILVFGDYQAAQTLIFPGFAGTPGPPHRRVFVFLGVRSPRMASESLGSDRLGWFAIRVNESNIAANINRLLRRRQGLLAMPEVRQHRGEIVERGERPQVHFRSAG